MPESAKPESVKEKGGKWIFITTRVGSKLKAKLQAAADKAGVSFAGYCREILTATVAGK